MTNQAAFYRQQAELERVNAEDAALDNVRERCLRAASSWDQMAHRIERVHVAREANERAKGDSVEA